MENPRGGDFARHYDDVVDGLAAHFVWANRGKESVTLDLKSDDGIDDAAPVTGTCRRAGVQPRPGGHFPTRYRARRSGSALPGAVAVEIDGYGPGGPLSHKRAYDLLVQAESGACAVTGFPGEPAKPGPPVADVSSGLYAALSILALLCARGRHR